MKQKMKVKTKPRLRIRPTEPFRDPKRQQDILQYLRSVRARVCCVPARCVSMFLCWPFKKNECCAGKKKEKMKGKKQTRFREDAAKTNMRSEGYL